MVDSYEVRGSFFLILSKEAVFIVIDSYLVVLISPSTRESSKEYAVDVYSKSEALASGGFSH